MQRRTVQRRTVLGLPVLGVAALAAAGCGDDPAVRRRQDQSGEGRIAYGDDPSQFGELRLPDGPPRGVVVVVHGGFWKAEYDLSLGSPLAVELVALGWAAWNLEYRRVGNGGGASTTFDDVAAGIDRLANLDVPLDTVVTLGHSAGGHLATWAASRTRSDRWAGGVEVTHVVSQAGVLDLGAAHEAGLGGGAVEAFLGHPPGPADALLDPVRQAPLDVPVWCVHGTDDDVVPISQSRSYVAAADGSAELVEVPGDHMSVIDRASDAWQAQLRILEGIA
ncbi:prolyl oligopeptidase family serine peptidase [Nocardioides sp. SYSU D00038]|uniref:alpha/beta hydrolase family protein n=1 Tax=Nocardioides sp. SYSU D00038 TaxID=2812554 RepID=UPI0027DD9ED3|nr:prolyl oligopeptidase family serine peptidase [Nocardioides sp. SYSU D00038]